MEKDVEDFHRSKKLSPPKYKGIQQSQHQDVKENHLSRSSGETSFAHYNKSFPVQLNNSSKGQYTVCLT